MSDYPLSNILEILAHRLRGPLSLAKAAAEELRMTAADPASQRIGEVVLGQVGQMDRMIDTLLDVSLLEAGRLQAAPHSYVDLQHVIEVAVEDCRSALESKSQRLVLQMPEEWPQIEGDEPRLVQIIRTLLANAVKFTPDGGSIEISIAAGASDAQIQVRDTGCGVTETLLPQLFEPFVLAGAAPHSDSGLGLSLTITKHLVELHNGTISAYSAGPGQGTQFQVCLPLANP